MERLINIAFATALSVAIPLASSTAFAANGCYVPGETSDVASPPCVSGGGAVARNILVTFGEVADLDPAVATPESSYNPLTGAIRYRGVTYTPLAYTPEIGALSLVIGGAFDDHFGFGDLFDCKPVTRYVKTPLLATLGPVDLPTIGVELVFDEPTPIFGFGFGFNDLERSPDGVSSGPVARVTLYDPDGRVVRRSNLFASRLYCCTEGDFDYVDRRSGRSERGLVQRAVITLTADYVPFDPVTGAEGTHKFIGLDWVRYQRTEVVPDCPSAP